MDRVIEAGELSIEVSSVEELPVKELTGKQSLDSIRLMKGPSTNVAGIRLVIYLW